MKRFSKFKGIMVFYAFDIILVLILLVSFLPGIIKTKNYYDSSVLNPKYVDSVSKIEISVLENNVRNTVVLERNGSNWTGSSSYDDYSSVFPCDDKSIYNMLNVSSNIVRMYKKTDKESHWQALGVDEDSAARVIFYSSTGEIYSELYYGIQDLMTQRIAVRSSSSEIVYDTENTIDTYLTTSLSFWTDPFLFPMCVTGYSRKDSEGLLRRGQIVSLSDVKAEDYMGDFSKIFENESSVHFSFYKTSDSSILVLPSFTPGQSLTDEKYKLVSGLKYCYTISPWTYEQLTNN